MKLPWIAALPLVISVFATAEVPATLTRLVAAKKIQDSTEWAPKIPIELTVPTGKIWLGELSASAPGRCGGDIAQAYTAQELGLVEVKDDSGGWIVTLTDAGKKAEAYRIEASPDQPCPLSLLGIAQKGTIKVTGIAFDGQIAAVTFVVQLIPINGGEEILSGDHSIDESNTKLIRKAFHVTLPAACSGKTCAGSGEALFRKWDNGWRLQSIN